MNLEVEQLDLGRARGNMVCGAKKCGAKKCAQFLVLVIFSFWFSTAAADHAAQFTAPNDASEVQGTSVTFSWVPHTANVSLYSLWVGSDYGLRDIYAGVQSGTSFTVTSLPADGSTIYARLYALVDGQWQLHDDHAYTNTQGPVPALTTPANDSTLSGSSTSFSWTADGADVDRWALWIGSSSGTKDVHGAVYSGTTATVNLPTDGSKLYARLYSQSGGTWKVVDEISFNAATIVSPEFIAPTPNTLLTGPTQTFEWEPNSINADSWALWLGTAPGLRDIAAQVSNTVSTTVTSVPTDGQTVYASLYANIDGRWTLSDEQQYTTAIQEQAELLLPDDGATLAGASDTFTWTANDQTMDKWSLWVGTGYGLADIHAQVTNDTSMEVSGLPTDGSEVFVRLYGRKGAAWNIIDERSFITPNTTVLPPVTPPVDLSRYNLVFGDDFDGPTLDTEKWATSYYWGSFQTINAEEQYYVDVEGIDAGAAWSPFSIEDSILTITAVETDGLYQATTQPPQNSSYWDNNPDRSFNPNYDADNVNYLSGVIASHKSYSFTHGYVESRMKVPSGKGLWSAFWLHTFKFVEDAPEIDIMEHLGEPADKVHHTMHYFDIQNNWALISSPTYATEEVDYSQNFHTYAVSWEPKKVDFFVDGVLVQSVSDNDFVIAKQAMHVLANLAVGGTWPGPPNADTSFPAELAIDYINVYQKKPVDQISNQSLNNEYILMFDEEFNGNALDSERWSTDYLWGPYFQINNEEQFYPDLFGRNSDFDVNPFDVSNGTLKITATTIDEADLPAQPPLNDPSWQVNNSHQYNPNYLSDDGWTPSYVSGLITSYDSFKLVHGYIEARMKIPEGSGLWPAFWLLNGYYVGPQPEMDIMEARGASTHEVHQSYHYSESNGQLTSATSAFTHPTPGAKFSDDFHQYGLAWQPGKLEWLVDREVVHTITGPHVSLQLSYIIANLAVGGNYVGDVDESVLPATLEIDYIRAWQRK